ncbi:uncharacterized protein C2orf42 homolog isoform X1 [Caloenas nicobarica]|uniref:uncharacterized protein C2orf42 homolog isoform X1 n=1 Tax=Caloenas nicobarica TaxID=187106 RepID=UPI0032B812A9
MEPAPARTKVPSFLSDLGKATLRGIRKCPRCGTYNGTRGLSCKNKTCGTVFRRGARKPPGADAVRIVTGSAAQVYSVRQRERGAEQRCFVELGVSETAIQTADGTVVTQLSSGRCSAPACLKAAARGAAENQCQHIKLALNCQSEATPLALKSSILNSLQAPPETKQSIWQLATEPTGPLVQRVTKSVLVVKRKGGQKPGPGYLHVSVGPRTSAKAPGEPRFRCSCWAPRHGKGGEEEEEEDEGTAPRCVHFFACVCAFASDESLAREFADLLAYDAGGLRGITVPSSLGSPESVAQAGGAAPARAKKRKKDVTPGTQPTGPLPAHAPALSHACRPGPRKPPVASAPKRPGCQQPPDESQVSLSFQAWLASVTERIHQTMHYQFEGQPEPLVFHIPQAFFDALQQRISSGSAKKRLPNSTTAFVRRDALPLGTFSKYTWHITNILQVKQIFDTPELPLELTRSFSQSRDGTYEPWGSPGAEEESVAPSPPEKQPPLRPQELQTFLKVGNTSPAQKEPTPFVIEWIPDILPRARVGELRLRFQYGRRGARRAPPDRHRPPPGLDTPLHLPPLATVPFP